MVVTKGENLQRLFANEHRTEAETKSNIQVENLINVAEFKANFMGKLYLIKSNLFSVTQHNYNVLVFYLHSIMSKRRGHLLTKCYSKEGPPSR